jgi:hypothetical protein
METVRQPERFAAALGRAEKVGKPVALSGPNDPGIVHPILSVTVPS